MESGTMDWTVIGVGIALAGLMLVTTRSIRAEIRDIRAEMKALADRLDKRIGQPPPAKTSGLSLSYPAAAA